MSLASPLPFDDHQFVRSYGRAIEPAELLSRAMLQTVFPGYLPLAGVQLESGRDFTMDDLTEQRPVAIIDGPQVLAKPDQPGPARVQLRPGLNVFKFRDRADDPTIDSEISFTYRATFTPTRLVGP